MRDVRRANTGLRIKNVGMSHEDEQNRSTEMSVNDGDEIARLPSVWKCCVRSARSLRLPQLWRRPDLVLLATSLGPVLGRCAMVRSTAE